MEISEIVTTISSAIEEQSIVTGEIARNMSMVSEGITEVNNNVNQSSHVSKEITHSITQVHESTDEMKTNSTQAKNSALGLSDLAQTLNKMMARFTV
jgi:methyl-accepting chemotaxis protein